jgi:hypothetical protein
MDTGRFTPSADSVTAAFGEDHINNEGEENSSNVKLGSKLRWDMCADIKVDIPRGDPPSYQMDMESVDYVKFEYALQHQDLIPQHVNRVYVQIHNRGIQAAKKLLSIKMLYANALVNGDSIKYPRLPQDFWTAFQNNSKDTSNWKPISEDRFLPHIQKTLTETEPTVLVWQWNVPRTESDKIGLLVIIDSPEDAIPESNKVFDIEKLVRNERHVGLRTVHSNLF